MKKTLFIFACCHGESVSRQLDRHLCAAAEGPNGVFGG